jgi:MHS family proline/betaine transporter-like MFS transporter
MNVDKLTKNQKKAVGIIASGNLLEYFDLMLFSHLAFVVCPYFMPKEDPTVAKLLSIFAFSSSFVIRPLGAIFWAYIGDNFGRAFVLTYTTLAMAITCFLIPNIPPYTEIGIYSTVLIIACRMIQGFSSAGEVKGAEVFIAEMVPKAPLIYKTSIIIPITCDLGGLLATLIGALCLSFSPDGWKTCFYIGACIAFCSSISRKKLKETKEFIDFSKNKLKFTQTPAQQYFEKRNFFALMGLNMICPTAFFFAFSLGSDLLKEIGLSPNRILLNNTVLLLLEIIFLYTCSRIACRIDPFKILRVRTILSFFLMPLCFFCISFHSTHVYVFLTQLVVLLTTASFDPATPLIIRSFGIKNRLSEYSKAAAFAKAFMYLSTGYVTYYLHLYFGLFGVLCLLIFFSTIFLISLNMFVPYDKMNILYQQKFKNKRLQEVELEEPAYESSKLKKWIEN